MMVKMTEKKKLIQDKLLELGFTPNTSGFWFLIDAVDMYHPGMSLTKEMYPAVAAKHGCRTINVERCIRHAIEKAYTYSNMLTSETGPLINKNMGKMANGEFIAFLSIKINDAMSGEEEEA